MAARPEIAPVAPAASAEPAALLAIDHEELVIRAGGDRASTARSGCTPRSLGLRAGRVPDVALPEPDRGCSRRPEAVSGDDPQGRGGRPAPRRRQGRDLPPGPTWPRRGWPAAGRAARLRRRRRTRWTARTSPPRTWGPARGTWSPWPREPASSPACCSCTGSGDPEPFTALGVEAAIRACCRERFDRASSLVAASPSSAAAASASSWRAGWRWPARSCG